MPNAPAAAAPAELRGIKDMTKLKGLAIDHLLTRLCPSVRRRLLPWVESSAFIQRGNVYLLITANCRS